jgi:hypothetical protein
MRLGISFIATFLGFAVVCEAQSGRAGSDSLRTPSRSAVFGVVGCYAFFDSAGRAASEKLYWAPATARLDSNGRAVKLTPKFDAGAPRGGPGSYRWSITAAGDTLRVLFHNGFSGTEFAFAWVGRVDTLRGRAQEHWDAGPPFVTVAGSATGVRIPC